MYAIPADTIPIRIFACRIICSLDRMYSICSRDEAPISLATSMAKDFVYASVGINMMYTALFSNAYAVYSEISSFPKLAEMIMVDIFHNSTEKPSGIHCFIYDFQEYSYE